MTVNHRYSTLVIALVLVWAVFGGGFAAEPPDSEVNPVTGKIESVQSIEQNGTWNVQHLIDGGQGAPNVFGLVSNGMLDDRGARVAITTSGRTGVVWWRDDAVGRVVLRRRTASTGVWSGETIVSETGENSRNPEIVADGTTFTVAFEFDAPGGGTGIGVRTIFDDPEPFPTRVLLATTAYGGGVDVLAHALSGKVWVTWVDSATDVGWSRYDPVSDTWSIADHESYAQDDVASARERIRASVTGS